MSTIWKHTINTWADDKCAKTGRREELEKKKREEKIKVN